MAPLVGSWSVVHGLRKANVQQAVFPNVVAAAEMKAD